MKDKIVILGTGTCNYEIEKASTSLLICSGETKIIYDFGYRVYFRLRQLGYFNNNIGNIIISHFHPDHFSDLIPFLHSCFYSNNKRTKILNIYSNENAFEFIEFIKKMLPAPKIFNKIVKIYKLKENQKFKISNIEIFPIRLSHFNNISIYFKLNNKKISITGDFNYLSDSLEFLKNSDYCFMNTGSLNIEQVIEFKNKFDIKKLIVLHSYKTLETNYPEIIIGKDLMEFQL